MSLLWFDGFETYVDRNEMLDGAYTSVGAGTFSQTNIVTDKVRHGLQAYQCGYASSDGTPSLRKGLGASFDVLGAGGAFYFNQLPSRGSLYAVLEFRSSTNTIQFIVTVDPAGRVVARRTFADPVVAASSAQAIFPQRWHHIEARIKCHLTTGEIEVRVDGETVLSEINVNTRDDTVTSGMAFVSTNRSSEGLNNGTFADHYVIDDFFIWDEAGIDHTTFIGDRGVHTLAPTADTSVAEFEVVGAGSGYEAIDDALPDDDVTYLVADALVGSTETASEFDFADLPATVQVVEALATFLRMRDSGGGGCDMQASLMSGASEAPGAVHALDSNWKFYQSILVDDPVTSNPWTPSGANAAQLRIARV